MRRLLFSGVSIWLMACAQAPSMPPCVAEVPMYTGSEWIEMNSVTTVPEIADTRLTTHYRGLGSFGGIHIHSSHMHMHR
jgi:hypothetical protein